MNLTAVRKRRRRRAYLAAHLGRALQALQAHPHDGGRVRGASSGRTTPTTRRRRRRMPSRRQPSPPPAHPLGGPAPASAAAKASAASARSAARATRRGCDASLPHPLGRQRSRARQSSGHDSEAKTTQLATPPDTRRRVRRRGRRRRAAMAASIKFLFGLSTPTSTLADGRPSLPRATAPLSGTATRVAATRRAHCRGMIKHARKKSYLPRTIFPNPGWISSPPLDA